MILKLNCCLLSLRSFGGPGPRSRWPNKGSGVDWDLCKAETSSAASSVMLYHFKIQGHAYLSHSGVAFEMFLETLVLEFSKALLQHLRAARATVTSNPTQPSHFVANKVAKIQVTLKNKCQVIYSIQKDQRVF